MYTANTMAAVAEAIGHVAARAAPRRRAPTAAATGSPASPGEAVVELLRQGITARQIMTKEAFENAIAVVMAFGGSTNAVLHLLAIAHEADVDLSLEDFRRIGATRAAPGRRQALRPLRHDGRRPGRRRPRRHAGAAGRRAAARRLPDRHRPDHRREPRRHRARRTSTARCCARCRSPIHRTGGITILHGSLAPEGAVVKTAGFDDDVFEGTARVFDREQGRDGRARGRRDRRRRRRRDPLRGPQGRPGHARDARHHRRDQGRRPGQGRAAAHRRPVLRRHDRAVRRPRRARGGRRRPDRVRPRRRPDPPRRRRPDPRPARRRGRARDPRARAGRRCRRATPAACWPSTPSWSGRPPPERSADRGELGRSRVAGRSAPTAGTVGGAVQD